jgi:hypothetical protein
MKCLGRLWDAAWAVRIGNRSGQQDGQGFPQRFDFLPGIL